MQLTPAQRQALKTNVLANADTLEAYTSGNLQTLADLYNATANPAGRDRKPSAVRDHVHFASSDGQRIEHREFPRVEIRDRRPGLIGD